MQDGALGLVFSEDRQQILLIQRKDVPIWVIPGGGIDPGERPDEAVIRELFEETGLEVSVVRQIARYSPANRFTHTAHVFECAVEGGVLSKGSEAQSIGYFPLNALPKRLFHYHREWIADALHEPSQIILRPMSAQTFWKIIAYYVGHPWWGLRYLFTRLLIRVGF